MGALPRPARPSRGARRLLPVLVLALLAAGCGSVPPPDDPPASAPVRLPGSPSYDARREPAAAVLPLVPASATRLVVTDLDEVRTQLGVPGEGGADPAADRADFWRRAAREAPPLDAVLSRGSTGRGRTAGAALPAGVSRDDVAWRAEFSGPAGSGWVLALHPDVDLATLARSLHAAGKPLRAARVLAGDRLVVSGVSTDSHLSWATDPAVVHLVGDPAEATYVHRGCLPTRTALGVPRAGLDRAVRRHLRDLAPLGGVALAFGDHIATVRTNSGRPDLFDRLRLGAATPPGVDGFAGGFRQGVADPTTGRLGFEVPRPALAAALVRRDELPPAVCPSARP